MPGLDKQRIEEIFTESKLEQWPYPEILNAQKDAGFEYYESAVSTCNIVDHGSGDFCTEPPPSGSDSRAPSRTFDKPAVQLAIQWNQAKQTDHAAFLQEISRAGVHSYRVGMNERSVTYLGAAGEQYVEKVSQF